MGSLAISSVPTAKVPKHQLQSSNLVAVFNGDVANSIRVHQLLGEDCLDELPRLIGLNEPHCRSSALDRFAVKVETELRAAVEALRLNEEIGGGRERPVDELECTNLGWVTADGDARNAGLLVDDLPEGLFQSSDELARDLSATFYHAVRPKP